MHTQHLMSASYADCHSGFLFSKHYVFLTSISIQKEAGCKDNIEMYFKMIQLAINSPKYKVNQCNLFLNSHITSLI